MTQTIMIVATDEKGGIGKGGSIPWRLPADLKRFKARTMGHALIMGRATYDSIGRPLPGRTTYVVSRQQGLDIDGVEVFSSPEAALAAAQERHEVVFVAGGAQIYEALVGDCDHVERTVVSGDFDCDTHLDIELPDGFVLQRTAIEDGVEVEYWRRQ